MTLKHLVIKDLLLQWKFLIGLIVMEVAAVGVFQLQLALDLPSLGFLLLNGMALVGDFLICYRTMVAEEKNRAFLFLRTLPVSIFEIVLGKFFANFVLVAANTGVLLLFYQGVHFAHGRGFTASFGFAAFALALLVHWVTNAFFLSIALIFDSERAVWIPFPVVFVVMSVLLNLGRIEVALHLEPLVEALGRYQFLGLLLLAATLVAFFCLSFYAVSRKRVFG